jgi:hypothetical protein
MSVATAFDIAWHNNDFIALMAQRKARLKLKTCFWAIGDWRGNLEKIEKIEIVPISNLAFTLKCFDN